MPTTELFPRIGPAQCVHELRGLLQPTPHLPDTPAPYKRRTDPQRRIADPIGLAGFSPFRAELDLQLLALCRVLIDAGGSFIGGKELTMKLSLLNTRQLRLLVAYGHVHHRLRQIVGLEGGPGYCWGESRPGSYEDAAAISRRKAQCSLFTAGLYSHTPTAMQVAQLCLDFRKRDGESQGHDEHFDEVAAWLESEHVTVGSVLDAIAAKLLSTDDGRRTLADFGRRHTQALLPVDVIARELDALKDRLLAATR